MARKKNNSEEPIDSGDPFYFQADDPEAGAAEIKQSRRSHRHPGNPPRKMRLAEVRLLRSRELKRVYRQEHAGAEMPADELAAAVEAYVASLYDDPDRDRFIEMWEETGPTSRSPQGNRRHLEMASMRWLPGIRWLERMLLSKTNLAGASARLRLVLAVFFQLGLGSGRKSAIGARADIRDNRPTLNWAHDYPGLGPAKSSFYDSLHNMLEKQDPSAAIAVNIDLHKDLQALVDDDGKRLHPNIGVHLAVDGTVVEADVQQRAAKGDLKALLHGEKREKVDAVMYVDNEGKPWKFAVGYRLTVLVDIASTLVIAAHFGPASTDEAQALRQMIRAVFEAWPEIPCETLSGDSLYSKSKDLARELVFNWGIQPIFPERKNQFSKDLPYAETLGVPHCACGEMQVRNREGFYDLARRRAKGMAPGEAAPNRARIRWTCPNSICKPVDLYPWKDARLYTYYPRQGRDELAIKRRVLLVRRNAAESVFASLKRNGCGGRGLERPSWANDAEYEWLLYVGLLGLTARRIAWESGLYAMAYDEADELGLLEQPSLHVPAPGPDPGALARARARRFEHLEPPRAPAAWPDAEIFELGAGDLIDEARARELTDNLVASHRS